MPDHNKLIKRYEQALAREQTLRKAAEARVKELEARLQSELNERSQICIESYKAIRERDEALKALEPFAKAADIKLCGEWRDDEKFCRTDVGYHLTFGDLRRARDVREKLNAKSTT